MDEWIIWKYERVRLQLGYEIEATVSGTSMVPTVAHGDVVVIRAKENYSIGDILMFGYNQNTEILLHRLVKKEEDRLFCKGDNSYRLEEIRLDDVWGAATWKVCKSQRIPLICPEGLPEASFAINRLLICLDYNMDLLKKSKQFQEYRRIYLDGERRS